MNNFIYQNPTKVIFGENTTNNLVDEMKSTGKNVLLVYGGGSIKENGLYNRVINQLADKNVYELAGVEPNPRLTTVYKGIQICKRMNIDFILAVGGGSVIDCAKAISVGALYDGDVWDFYKKKAYPTAAIPVGDVLTLAATGTEMNGNSVITNMETHEKIGFSGVYLLHPVFSILDPINTYSVPNNQTANGCADILSHLFEDYFSYPDDTPIQDGFAETIMKTVFSNAFAALEKPDDYNARANLMWCGTLALNGVIPLGKEGDWGCHAIEHVLSAHYDIPHGAGLAIITPPYMKYMCQFNPKKYKQYAINIFGINPEGKTDYEIGLEGIALTKNNLKKMGVPVTLHEVGIGSEKFDLMTQEMFQSRKIGSYKILDREELLQILREAL